MAATSVYRSKLGGEYSREYIERMDKQHHLEIKRIRELPENRQCAECQAAPTTWASVSLGVFVCMRCSQVHRNLGAHISKVKSCMGTYLWCPDELERMRNMGNARAAALYAHSRPANQPKPAADCSFDEVDAFARAKYDERRWLHPGGLAAVVAEEGARPVLATDAAAAADESEPVQRQSRQTAANNRAAARAKARALRGKVVEPAAAAADNWAAAWDDAQPSPRRPAPCVGRGRVAALDSGNLSAMPPKPPIDLIDLSPSTQAPTPAATATATAAGFDWDELLASCDKPSSHAAAPQLACGQQQQFQRQASRSGGSMDLLALFA